MKIIVGCNDFEGETLLYCKECKCFPPKSIDCLRVVKVSYIMGEFIGKRLTDFDKKKDTPIIVKDGDE